MKLTSNNEWPVVVENSHLSACIREWSDRCEQLWSDWSFCQSNIVSCLFSEMNFMH